MRAALACEAACPTARYRAVAARRPICARLLSGRAAQADADPDGDGVARVSAAGLSAAAASVAAQPAVVRQEPVVRGRIAAERPPHARRARAVALRADRSGRAWWGEKVCENGWIS